MWLMKNKIIQGDCLIKLKELEDNSVDSIVTDPPYELGFMGKSWDNTGIANNKEMWAECLRVLKPGGHLLAFSGTRTYHRMASAIEDAGFEVRDMIEWVYGSGFPKSLNIGKAVDKMEGVEHPKNTPISDNGSMSGANYTRNKMDVQSELGKQWEGWGTALKPAHEPICMARKPISEKTVAENCLKWGVGGINIDGCRVGTEEKLGRQASSTTMFGNGKMTKEDVIDNSNAAGGRFPANLIHDNSDEVVACFPNSKSTGGTGKIGLDSDVNLGGGNNYYNFGDSGSASRFFKSILYYPKASRKERNIGCEGLETSKKFTAGNYSQSPTCKTCDLTLNGTNDHSECSGEVYYKEMESKNTKNNHPTVKPLKLMEYLIKMVTPKGGIVLDPFAGSGTTCMAAKKIGRDFIGIEKEPDYVAIAEARIKSIPESLF